MLCPYLTLPYLTFLVGSVSYSTLRPYLLGKVCNPDVTVGHLVVLASRIRDKGLILLNSSISSKCDPKLEYLSFTLAGHLPTK